MALVGKFGEDPLEGGDNVDGVFEVGDGDGKDVVGVVVMTKNIACPQGRGRGGHP